jgi:dipeptidyl aminopeptidase/acylaminoacyl peptidase
VIGAAPPPDEDAAQLGNENPPEPRNEVVLVDLATGVQRVLVSGPDFVAAPRLSPAEDELAWLAWDHPEMPWDGARLQVASYDPLASPGGDDDGTVGPAIHLGGGGGTAATRPVWRPDGTLVTTLDTSGYWEVHVRDGEGLRPVTSLGADVGVPLWRFGDDVLAPLGDGRIAAVVIDRAVARLVLVDLADGAVTELGAPYTSIRQLRATAAGVAFLGASPDVAGAVVRWSPEDGFEEVATIEVAQLHAGDHPTAAAVEVATDDGATTHAFLYRPANAEVTGPDDERPPLVVFTHGGPTGNVGRVLSPAIAYWTTRGFAVADVNYRGSSGYGRAYRDQLRGAWGLHDVADTIAVATELARRGEVDGDRMVIRGGSAGGFTTLAVLTAPAHPFAAGTSFFGVSDLAGLAEHTHKFESRYLDGLVGPYPEAADVYRERSPLTHVDRLRTPVLVLQGLEDRVVPPEQAEAITAAAAERGLPHAYLAFPGEQHGFRKAENVVTWLQSELAFYGQVLGFTPAGDLPHLDLGDR